MNDGGVFMKKFANIFFRYAFLMTFVVAGCTGCAGGKELKMEELRNEANEFQYPSLDWGSSVEDVEAAFGVTLESMGTAQGREVYLASQAVCWNHVEADVICEFEEGKLDTISLTFQPDEAERNQFWESLEKELTETFGSTEKSIQESTSEELNITTQSESYLWEYEGTRHTALALNKFTGNGQFKYIQVSVYVVPDAAKEK